MRHLFLFLSLCISLLQEKTTNPPLMATTHNQPPNQSTYTHQREISNPRPQPTTQPMVSTHNKPLQSTTESINPHP